MGGTIDKGRTRIIGNILGRDPNCFTGADCWNYDHSTRSIWIIGVILAVSLILYTIKKKRGS